MAEDMILLDQGHACTYFMSLDSMFNDKRFAMLIRASIAARGIKTKKLHPPVLSRV
jgi:hypothetical protein